MQLKMELSKHEHEFSENEIKIKRLFWELQTFANPYYTSIEDIKAEEILQCAKDMLGTKTKLLSLSKTVKSIKEQLGED